MIVRDILEAKPAGVITVHQNARIGDAIAIMARQDVGSIIVLDDERHPISLLSENAIIFIMAARGSDAIMTKLSDLNVRPPYMVRHDQKVRQVEREMTHMRRRHALVTRGGVLAGLISIGDILKARLADARMETNVLRDMARTKMAFA